MNTRKRFLAALLAISILLVVGCGSTQGGGTGNGGAAKDDKPVVVIEGATPTTLEPHIAAAIPELNVMQHIFEGLVQRNEELQIVGHLAESFELEDDNLTWTFKLKQGVTFSNGEPFNAEAAKFTFDRAMDPDSKTQGHTIYLLTNLGVDSVAVKDEYTFQIKTKKPNPTLPNFLSEMWMLAPKYYTENNKEFTASNPIGTGPYVLKEWKKNDRVVIERRDDYYGDKPAIKEVIFRSIPEEATRIAELETGGADIITNVSPDNYSRVQGFDHAGLHTVQGGRRIFIGLTQYGNPALTDKNVRQALNYAVDFDTINEALLQGAAVRQGVNVNPPDNNPDVKPYPHDPDKALSLFAQAGWEPNAQGILTNAQGETLSLRLLAPNGRYIKDKDIASAVAADLKKLGVDIELVVEEWAVYAPRTNNFDFADMFLLGSGPAFVGQGELSDVKFDSGSNYSKYHNPEFEETWAELAGTVDAQKRKELMYKAQQILHDDPPYIFLYMQVDSFGVSNRLNWTAPKDERINLKKATLK